MISSPELVFWFAQQSISNPGEIPCCTSWSRVDLCLYAKNAASTQTNMKALARIPIMATMSETETFDVVIAGGGIVGTTLARLLSDLDSKGNPLRVALLDRAAFDKQRLPFVSQPESFDPR